MLQYRQYGKKMAFVVIDCIKGGHGLCGFWMSLLAFWLTLWLNQRQQARLAESEIICKI